MILAHFASNTTIAILPRFFRGICTTSYAKVTRKPPPRTREASGRRGNLAFSVWQFVYPSPSLRRDFDIRTRRTSSDQPRGASPGLELILGFWTDFGLRKRGETQNAVSFGSHPRVFSLVFPSRRTSAGSKNGELWA